jgi:hypothetical protein
MARQRRESTVKGLSEKAGEDEPMTLNTAGIQ